MNERKVKVMVSSRNGPQVCVPGAGLRGLGYGLGARVEVVNTKNDGEGGYSPCRTENTRLSFQGLATT